MPQGAIGYSTLASDGVGDEAESAFFSIQAPATALVDGTNVLAVEVHQFALESSDISFDLRLTGQGSGDSSGYSVAAVFAAAVSVTSEEVRDHLLGKSLLSGAALLGADADGSGTIDITDLISLINAGK